MSGAETVTIWGSGRPRREFLHVDDLADACVFLMDHNYEARHINVRTGTDLSILELAEQVREIVYPNATLHFDSTKPDGSPRKLLDVSRLQPRWDLVQETLRSPSRWLLVSFVLAEIVKGSLIGAYAFKNR